MQLSAGQLTYFLSIVFLCLSCSRPEPLRLEKPCTPFEGQTKNVIVVVIDGPRMSETWEHPTHRYIPYQSNFLQKRAVVNREFYNLGNTYTVPGHIALTTGSYDFKTNNGQQYPAEPSFFQMFLECTSLPPSKACMVGSKRKLEVLQDCESLLYRNAFLPNADMNDRSDLETYARSLEIMERDTPVLMMIHFKGPDAAGHHANWTGYLEAIVETDSLLYELVNYLDQHDYYANTTSIIVTNDHGRHLDGIRDGFVSHGDHCRGCTHINFLGLGPDFHRGHKIFEPYELVDIAPTIGYIFGFAIPTSEGRVMHHLFK